MLAQVATREMLGEERPKRVTLDEALFRQVFSSLPPDQRQTIEDALADVAASVVVTRRDLEQIIRDVAKDLGYKVDDDLMLAIIRQLLTRHFDAEYVRERVDDILADDAEETLREMHHELTER